jgi:hypothetical protein
MRFATDISIRTGLHKHVLELQQEVVAPPLCRLCVWRSMLCTNDIPIGPPLVLLQNVLLPIAFPLGTEVFVHRAGLQLELVGPLVGEVFVDEGTEEDDLILPNGDNDAASHVVKGIAEGVDSGELRQSLMDGEIQSRLDGRLDRS